MNKFDTIKQKTTRLQDNKGFSLIELVVVIVIMGVLTLVAVRSFVSTTDTRLFEETKLEMEMIKRAIVGDPDMIQDGYRVDFGYVGDMGDIPSGLSDLVNFVAGRNWNGPYIEVNFVDNPDDYLYDAYNEPYTYLPGGLLRIYSPGAETSVTIADSLEDLTNNTVRFFVRDRDGFGPTPGDEGNITITLTLQDTRVFYGTVQAGGLVEITGVPIGNHIVTAAHSLLPGDVPTRPVSVNQGASPAPIDLIFISLPE